MLLLVCLLLGIWSNAGECFSSEMFVCPTWMHRNSQHNHCECGSGLHQAIICNGDSSTVYLVNDDFCMFVSEELNTTLIGTCPYGSGGLYQNSKMILHTVVVTCIEKVSFVGNVMTITLSQSIHTT